MGPRGLWPGDFEQRKGCPMSRKQAKKESASAGQVAQPTTGLSRATPPTGGHLLVGPATVTRLPTGGGTPGPLLAALAEIPADPSGPNYFIYSSSFGELPETRQRQMLSDLAVYRQELPRLLQEEEAGRFALVREGAVASVWDTAGDALQASRLIFGPEPASVYEVRASDLRRFGLPSHEERAPECPR